MDLTLREVERDLGVGTPARDRRRNPEGANVPSLVGNLIFRVEFSNLDVQVTKSGGDTITEYITPRGTISTLYRRSPEMVKMGLPGLEVEHLIKSPEDYPAVEFLIQNTEIIPTYEDYMAFEKEIGEDGIPLIYIGQDPMSRFLMELVGYEKAYYHLNDYPDLVNHLLSVLQEQLEKIWQVTADSPARLILHGQHFDSFMTPPKVFQQYMLPYYQSFTSVMQKHGKIVTCHADADTKKLLNLIKDCGFDMVKCFVTAPMVSVTIEEARECFGTDVIIWGGIPSVILCEPYTDEEFTDYLDNLFRAISPGAAFILGVADNVMPEAKLSRLKHMRDKVDELGNFPIQLNAK